MNRTEAVFLDLKHPARNLARRLNRWRVLRRLTTARSAAPALVPALDALEAALRQGLSAEEAAAVRAIEALRARVAHDRAALEVTDYGALPNGDAPPCTGNGRLVATTVSAASCGAKSPFWCRFLFGLVRATRPATVLELGTSMGISASYLATAQRLNGGGRLVSIEGAPALASLARGHVAELGLSDVEVANGRFAELLGPTLERLPPIDFVFLDGHHDGTATLEYFEQVRPHLAPDAVVVFDDISWSPGMAEAWEQVRRDRAFAATLDLRVLGVGMVGARNGEAEAVRIPVIGW
jgi:predicted O-methyltransferase YrrM